MTELDIPAPLHIDGTFNFRAVPPFRAGTSTLRARTLFRSDALDHLTPDGVRQLAALEIGCVLDLRSADERTGAPIALGTAEIVNVPIFDTGRPTTVPRTPTTLAGVYDEMIDRRGRELTRAVRRLATSGGRPVVVNCAAGKDRTGLVVALTLLACGVDRHDVIGDYSLSAANLAGTWVQMMRERMSAAGYPDIPEEVLVASPAETMASIIDRLEIEWGSAERYLALHGLDAADRQALVAALVHP